MEGLLFQADQDGNRCRIITVATSLAASAAARLLAKGDCSLAYENATIHCHGARYEGNWVLTRERAESMSRSLSVFNEEMAKTFMHRIIENLPWLYQFSRDEIERRQVDSSLRGLPHIPALSMIIQENLDPRNLPLLKGVIAELNLVGSLEQFLQKPSRLQAMDKARARGRGALDFRLLKLIVDFLEFGAFDGEVKKGIESKTVSQLTDLFSLRRDYYERFLQDCDDAERLLMMFCKAETLKELQGLPEAKYREFLFGKAGDALLAAWQLATTLSANLVRGENSLSASDAYWLGIVEEVIGRDDLPCRRRLIESGPG